MSVSRRPKTHILLMVCMVGLCAPALPLRAAELSAGAADVHPSRIRLYQIHTGESIDVAYKNDGNYIPSSLAMLNHFLRDYRTGQDASYDPREFDLLHAILKKLHRPYGVIDVICGYRSPETNEALREAAPVTGVAENSLHMQSKAIDIAIPDVSTVRLRNAAISLHMGGVGY